MAVRCARSWSPSPCCPPDVTATGSTACVRAVAVADAGRRDMTTHQPESEWIQRMQSIATEAIARAGESPAGFQRLLLAVAAPEVSGARIADELTRFTQRQAVDAYQGIAQVNA